MGKESKRKFDGEDIYHIASYFFLAAVPARFILDWDVTNSFLAGAGASLAMLILRLLAKTAPSCSIVHKSLQKTDNLADDGDSEEPQGLREKISLYWWMAIIYVVLFAWFSFFPLAIFTVVSFVSGTLKVAAIALSLALYMACDGLLYAIYRSLRRLRTVGQGEEDALPRTRIEQSNNSRPPRTGPFRIVMSQDQTWARPGSGHRPPVRVCASPGCTAWARRSPAWPRRQSEVRHLANAMYPCLG
jgi:hypothetical protein